jgi:hypothetical protein
MPNITGWGGARAGAGRPKGSKAVRTKAKATVEKAAVEMQASGAISAETAKMTPLDVILRSMWLAVEQGNWSAAASFAREAAPYLHSKLSSVDVHANIRKDASALTDEELMALAAAAKETLVVIP